MAKDPYRYFRVEARELLEQLGQGLLGLERGEPSKPQIARLLRLAHTLKGAARVVKQREIADAAHAIEGELAPWRDSGLAVSRPCIDKILALLDSIGHQLDALGVPRQPLAGPGSPAEPSMRTIRTDVGEMDALLEGIGETHSRLRRLRRSLGSLERARHLAHVLSGLRPANRKGVPPSGHERTIQPLMAELGGLLSRLEGGLGRGFDELDRELRQVRTAAQQLRLTPASVLFAPLERLARDAARNQDKEIIFEGRGGNVRLDADVLDAAQAALVQVVNNAVVHGIEAPAVREGVGKTTSGRIVVEVSRRGAQVILSCTDDGAGINMKAVRASARRKGWRTEEVELLDDAGVVRLLLNGGISTAAVVSEVAGRGIGLDLAREVVEARGGGITLHRGGAAGGTRVEMAMPLSMASLDSVLIEAGGRPIAIPLDVVRRTSRISQEHISRTPQGEMMVVAGQGIPFAPLSRLLDLQADPLADRLEIRSVVIIESAKGRAAIGVERLLGVSNVVFRPLPELAVTSALVAGAWLDAEGQPQLVLDAEELVAGVLHAPATDSERRVPVRHSVLVVDDSLTTRMLEQSILESAGFDVGTAASAEEALQQMRDKAYSLLLVDVEMPGMNGFELVERVRADPDRHSLPAILVTSRSSAEDRHRGAAAGAQGFIVKSEFHQADFLRQVRQLVTP